MELKLGKMTTKELAQWFGVNQKTYTNSTSKYLEKLARFAEFEKIHGGVIIKDIYIAAYDKQINTQIDTIFLEEAITAQDHLMTIAGLARKYSDELNLSESQTKKVFTRARDRLFGVFTDIGFVSSKGLIGTRESIWAIKVTNTNCYRLLTPEEDELLDLLTGQLYAETDPKKIRAQALLEETFRNSDMSKEVYLLIKDSNGLNFFHDVIMRFKAATGNMIVHANRYEVDDGYNFNSPEEESEYKALLRKAIDKIKSEKK